MNEPPVNILLVDDEPNNLVALEAILEKAGRNLVKASSGEEALKYLLHHDVAVILLDVQMPGMDGFETAQIIRERERSRDTPILFLTAYSKEEADISRGYSLGAVDYIFKPIEPEILKPKVAVFVERKRAEETLARSNAELAASRAFLAAVLDSTDDAILTVTEDGIVQSANKAATELYGYGEKEWLGRNLSDFLDGSCWSELQNVISKISPAERENQSDS